MTADTDVPELRFSLQRTDDGESLVIPAVRIRLIMGFLTFWLVIWTLVGIGGVVSAEIGNLAAQDVLFALFWTFAWIGASTLLLWMFTGREIVRFRGGDLEVVRSAFLLSRRWVYHGPAVRGLRVEPRPWLGTPRGGAFPFFGNSRFGAIRFSYRGWTKDLALGLDETEAKEILEWLRKGLSPHKAAGDGD
jgi:hypothetical protein